MPCSSTPIRRKPMATPTLEEKLTQLQLMSAPAFLAAWGERHPAERARVREVLERLVDQELARRSEQKVAARIKAARFVQLQTAETFHFDYSAGHPEAPEPVPEPLGHGSGGRGDRGALRRRERLGQDTSCPRPGVRPVPAGAERPVHVARRHGEPPERRGGDEDVASGAQDLPEPGAAPDRRGRATSVSASPRATWCSR